MKSLFKFVFIFLFCTVSACTVSAKPTCFILEDGTLAICAEEYGDVLDLNYYMLRPYDKIKISGPLDSLDIILLESKIMHATVIDLIEVELQTKNIGCQSFVGLKNLEEIRLPRTLESIGSCSFNDCPNLKTVVWPDRLSGIGNWAFQNCPKLEVKISSHVRFGMDTFRDSKVKIISAK